MTPAAQDLARKLAAHPGFRWMPGMRGTVLGMTFRVHQEGGRLWAFSENNRQQWAMESLNLHGVAIDLDDPATVGCVEAQVRALAPRRRFVLYESNSRWILQLQSLECVVLWATGSTTRGAVWAAAFLDVALMDFVASPEVLAKSVSDK